MEKKNKSRDDLRTRQERDAGSDYKLSRDTSSRNFKRGIWDKNISARAGFAFFDTRT